VASLYIPAAGSVDPRNLRSSVGHGGWPTPVFTAGDVNTPFSVLQSIHQDFHPFAIALADSGDQIVPTNALGRETLGDWRSTLSCSSEAVTGRPRNPQFNAGAIVTTARSADGARTARNFAEILQFVRAAASDNNSTSMKKFASIQLLHGHSALALGAFSGVLWQSEQSHLKKTARAPISTTCAIDMFSAANWRWPGTVPDETDKLAAHDSCATAIRRLERADAEPVGHYDGFRATLPTEWGFGEGPAVGGGIPCHLSPGRAMHRAFWSSGPQRYGNFGKKGTQAMARLAREMGLVDLQPARFILPNKLRGKRPRGPPGGLAHFHPKSKTRHISCRRCLLFSINSDTGLAEP